MSGSIQLGDTGPVAVETTLGWVLNGYMGTEKNLLILSMLILLVAMF